MTNNFLLNSLQSKLTRYLFSILSGLLLFVSFPYTGSQTYLIFIALVPLLLVETHITQMRYSIRKVYVHALITFLIYNFGATWWISYADVGGALMACILNSLLMAVFFTIYHYIRRNLGKPFDLIGLLVVWTGFEFIHYHWEVSWPWLNFGNAFAIQPAWVQWYSVTGILGGTVWILLVNYFIAQAIVKSTLDKFRPVHAAIPGLIILVPLAVSLLMYNSYEQKGATAEVIIVQPNIDPYYEKFSSLSPSGQLYRICDLVDSLVSPATKLIVAPETAIPFPFDEAIAEYDGGVNILNERMKNWYDADLLIGASTEKRFNKKRSRASRFDRNSNDYYESYNSSALFTGTKRPAFLHKSQLVLGAEKVPFSNIFPQLEELSMDLGGSSGTLGIDNDPGIFSHGHIAVTPTICYESVYGEQTAFQTRKGARLIGVITNDGWWDNTAGHKQHFAFSRLRAIENRRDVARSANTGISGFINQRGDIVQSTDWWTIDVIKGNVHLNTEETLYMTFGDLLGKMSSILMVMLLGYAIYKKKFVETGKSV